MKTVLMITVMAIALAIAGSCKKSKSYIPECSGVTPKFSTDVSALMSSRCATSGCHNTSSKNGPGALTTYEQIKNATADIRKSVVSGNMPNNGSLTTAEKNAIICWIDAGAYND